MRNIAITGSEGFIGTHLQRALKALYGTQGGKYARIECIDIKKGGDILDTRLQPDTEVIFHLAAQTSVQDSVANPVHDAMTNIAGTLKVLLDNPTAKVLITASGAAKEPKSPYGISKLAQELYAQVIHSNAVVLRLPNIFGEDDHGVVGRYLREPQATVYGDGEQTRDFVHVDDIAQALIQAMDWPAGVYECGTGHSHRILDLARATDKEIRYKDALPGEINLTSMANTTPNWKPTIDVIEFIKTYAKS